MRILTVLPLVLIATVCNAQIGAKTKQAEITGIWQNNQFGYQMTLMLNADGSGEFDGEEIKYKAQSGILALTIVQKQTTTNYKYALSGSSLTVSGGDLEQPVTFTKAGSAPISTPPQPPVQDNANPQSQPATGGVDKNLIGAWNGNGENLEFKPDGSCVYLGNTFQYQASNGQITLTTQQGSAVLAYTIKGTQLLLNANGQQLTYNRGAASVPTATGAKNVPQELVGKWCWISVTNTNTGGASSDRCITLNADGSYFYAAERSTSVNDPSFSGGTSSQTSDRGTWWVQGDRIFYNSQSQGQGSYSLEKRNHPKNVGDPMIVLDGQPYVTAFQKAPWR